jgi:hypothetical protein
MLLMGRKTSRALFGLVEKLSRVTVVRNGPPCNVTRSIIEAYDTVLAPTDLLQYRFIALKVKLPELENCCLG